MIVLLDTSTSECKLTLIDRDARYEYAWQADRRLAKELLGYIRDRLAEHHIAFDAITGIGVLRGPGSFTGLRIGLTVMNTLADSLHIPIVGTTSDDWQSTATARLQNGENDKLVVPEYGAEAHITKPRK